MPDTNHMRKEQDLLLQHEEWLMERVLRYAKEREYTKYTSTLAEAWRVSISGLTESIVGCMQQSDAIPELGPDEDYSQDPAASFGILEAKKHRSRGISLGMFLGLMKYYRQSYLDLTKEALSNSLDQARCEHMGRFIERVFDRIEIGFSSEWSSLMREDREAELQDRNRAMTNEKNKYLTMLESLQTPVWLLDSENIVQYFNHAAAKLFNTSHVPGAKYYGDDDNGGVFPLLHKELNKAPNEESNRKLNEELHRFVTSTDSEHTFVWQMRTKEESPQTFQVNLKRMLDVSEKFTGTVIILNDVTAIEQAKNKLNEANVQLERMAITDALTATYNRRHFIARLNDYYELCKRHGRSVSILMIDLDHFKQINDLHGHAAGDKVLVDFVDRAMTVLRVNDVLARLGGEEFAAILPETSLEGAKNVAERIRRSFCNAPIEHQGVAIPCTISVGCSEIRAEDDSSELVLNRADQALYAAKQAGRNQVNMGD